MPLSRLDLPAIRAAVSDLYRILEDPTPTNPVAARVYRRSSARTTQGEQNPDGVVPSALIRAGTDELVVLFGGHFRDQCPELADAHFDLETKAALLELRAELIAPFAAHRLGSDSGLRVRFLASLSPLLKRLETMHPSAKAELGATPPVPKVLEPDHRVQIRAAFERALAFVPEPYPTGPHGTRAEAEARWREAHGKHADTIHAIATEWVRELSSAAIMLRTRLETWPTVPLNTDDELVAFDVLERAARLWDAEYVFTRMRAGCDLTEAERHAAAVCTTHEGSYLRELLMNLICTTAASLDQFRASVRTVVARLMAPPTSAPSPEQSVAPAQPILRPDQFRFPDGTVAGDFPTKQLLLLRTLAPAGDAGVPVGDVCGALGYSDDARGRKSLSELVKRTHEKFPPGCLYLIETTNDVCALVRTA